VNSASGTTDNLLVTTDNNGDCINITNGQTNNIIGIVHAGTGGTSGMAQISQIGTESLILDNQSVIEDCVVAATTGAQGHDVGSQTCPSGVQQIGRVTSLNSGAGTAANVRIFISDIISQSQGQAQVIQINGATISGTLANFNGTTPSAQTNNQNLVFQTDNGSPTSNISVEVPLATTSQQGIIKIAQDLCGTYLLPDVCGIQTIPVTFSSIAANDIICFPTTSTLGNCKFGVPIRTVSGNSDTILATDRVSDVRYTAASGATAVVLPQAGSVGFTNNITMVVTNAQGSGAVTITPTVSTINGAATLVIPAGNYCFIYSDNTNYFANCGQTGGGSTITGSGTNNTMTKWTGASTIGNSSVTDDGTNPTRVPNGANTAAQGNYDEWTVDTGGVTANKLACRSSNNKAQICATSVTTGVLGVALTTQTNGQTVSICWAAHCSVIPANNTTSGHWLIPSATVAGDVDDTGSTTQPTGTQTFLAESSVTSPAVVATTILSPDAIAAASGGRPNTTEINGTVDGLVTNFNGTTPAADANNQLLTWKASTSGNTTSASVEVPLATTGQAGILQLAGALGGTSSSPSLASTYRQKSCDIAVGDESVSSALTSAQLGPQVRLCQITAASTAVQITVSTDASTSSVIVGRSRCTTFTSNVCTAETKVNLLSSALAAATGGFDACSNTGGTTGIDGGTTCSSTLQNTSFNAGDYIYLVSGTADGTSKLMTIHVYYTVN
jgi:hypothetical protein